MCFKERCIIGILSSSGSTQRLQLGFSSQLERLKGAGPSLLLQAVGMDGSRGCQEALGLAGSAGDNRDPLQEAT